MANANQVIVNGETILDLRSDTVTPETLQKGYTAHDKSGTKITGTLEAGSVSVQPSKSVSITQNGTTTVTPDTGYDALGKVDVTTNVMSGGEESCKLKINVTAPPSDDPEWALYICPGRLDSEEIVLDANNPSAEISIPSKGPFVLYTKNGNYIDSVPQDWGYFDYLDEASGYIALKYSGANTYVCYAGDTGTGTWDIQFY